MRIAFSRLFFVTMSRGATFFFTRESTVSPLSRAIRIFAASTAGIAAQPGRDIPIVSVMQAIVFAV